MRALVVALAAVAILVPAAIALGGAVRNLFFGTPAPPIIERAFASQNEMRAVMKKWERAHHVHGRVMPEVNGHKAHGVLAVSTSDGPLLLWAAPAAGGKQCWFIDFAKDQVGHRRATGDGGCDSTPPPSKIAWGYGWSIAHPNLKVLSGRESDAHVFASDKQATRAYAIATSVGLARCFGSAFANEISKGAPGVSARVLNVVPLRLAGMPGVVAHGFCILVRLRTKTGDSFVEIVQLNIHRSRTVGSLSLLKVGGAPLWLTRQELDGRDRGEHRTAADGGWSRARSFGRAGKQATRGHIRRRQARPVSRAGLGERVGYGL